MRPIPDDVLDRPAAGVNLMPGTLRDQLGRSRPLPVFLRHFGCLFCRETVADLRAAAEASPDFPPVLFFYQGTPTEGRMFLRRLWPAVRGVADRELFFYDAFGVGRGGPVKMFGAGVWNARRRARAKGHASGRPLGDVWRMPGLFRVDAGRVVWAHDFRHAADHPDFARIPELARTGS